MIMKHIDYLMTKVILYKKDFANRFAVRKNTEYQKFIILGFPRTGTTLLHTYLNSHPSILSMGEINLPQPSSNNASLFPPFSFKVKVAGVKVLLPFSIDEAFSSALREFIKTEPDLKIILLKRTNPIKTYVSYKIALKTNAWTFSGKSKLCSLDIKKVNIDIPDLLNFLSKTDHTFEYYRSLCSGSSICTVTYEDMARASSKVLEEVQNFLNVLPTTLISLLKKQNQESLPLLIRNYPEVASTLQGTPYFQFLDEE